MIYMKIDIIETFIGSVYIYKISLQSQPEMKLFILKLNGIWEY